MIRWSSVLLTLLLLATVAGTAPALTISQTILFDQIAPFGTFTTGDFVASGWGQAFPFTNAAQISEIRLHFTSEDRYWNDGFGPLGGEPMVEIGFLDDSANRFAVASVSKSSPSIILGPAQDPWFSDLRALVADGAVTASLGGFENFPGYTDAFTFTGPSSLTMEIDGAAPVPEPSSLALIGLGLGAAGLLARRRRVSR